MFLIKISVALILVAATIAPILAIPVPGIANSQQSRAPLKVVTQFKEPRLDVRTRLDNVMRRHGYPVQGTTV